MAHSPRVSALPRAQPRPQPQAILCSEQRLLTWPQTLTACLSLFRRGCPGPKHEHPLSRQARRQTEVIAQPFFTLGIFGPSLLLVLCLASAFCSATGLYSSRFQTVRRPRLSHDVCLVFCTCVRSADGQQTCTLGVVGPVVSDLSGPRQPTHGLRQKVLLHLCAVCGGVPLWVLKQAGVVLAGLAAWYPGVFS